MDKKIHDEQENYVKDGEGTIYTHIKSYGASRASSLRPQQKKIFEELYPLYGLELNDLFSWSSEGNNPKVVEIGCGMGDATVEIAQGNLSSQYLAMDVYKPGIVRILRECQDLSLSNLKLFLGDAMLALEEFKDNSLDGFHIFFPDPWPKDRHHKRRLMRDTVIDKMAQKLKVGGFLYFATDWEPYAQDVLDKLNTSLTFKNEYGVGYAQNVKGRPSTRFEQKGLEKGHSIHEIYFTKRL